MCKHCLCFKMDNSAPDLQRKLADVAVLRGRNALPSPSQVCAYEILGLPGSWSSQLGIPGSEESLSFFF